MNIMLIPTIIFNFILIAAIYFLLVRPMLNGAIFFTTQRKSIDVIIRMAGARPDTRVADLGSGDGRILISFARQGAEAHGYEINPLLVLWSRLAIRRAGLRHKAFVHCQSFWKINLSNFDVIVIYGIPYIMERMEKKIEQEMKPGAKIISNIYQLPNWRPDKEENGIYLYARTSQKIDN